jgi:hypothetical protein
LNPQLWVLPTRCRAVGVGDYIPKPKWMRWRTFERALARIDKVEAVVEAHTALLLDRMKQDGDRFLK